MKASVATTAGLSAQRSEVYLIFIAASAKYLRQIYFMYLQESTRTYPCFFLLTRITMGVFDNLILHRSSRKCTEKCTEMCTILRVNTHAAQCDRGLKVHDMTLGHILTWDTDIYCQLMKQNLNR